MVDNMKKMIKEYKEHRKLSVIHEFHYLFEFLIAS